MTDVDQESSGVIYGIYMISQLVSTDIMYMTLDPQSSRVMYNHVHDSC